MCFYIINHKLPSCICKDVYSLRFAQVFEDEETPSVPLLRGRTCGSRIRAHRNHGNHRKGGIKRDNVCEFREFCVRLKGYTARKPQKRVASREIISVRSVKSVWDLKLRFPQVFEDERGLAGGEVALSFSVASLD